MLMVCHCPYEILITRLCECVTASCSADEDIVSHELVQPPIGDTITPVLPASNHSSYHVFLCHRGPDTKKTVVDVLRLFLQEARNLRCFVDYDMDEGDDFPQAIRQAIRNSKFCLFLAMRNLQMDSPGTRQLNFKDRKPWKLWAKWRRFWPARAGVVGGDRSIFVEMLFNKVTGLFQSSCILLNVEEQMSSPHGLVKLHRTLLRHLVKVKNLPKIQNTAQGLGLVKQYLGHVKCLIVIDGLAEDCDMEQLRSLLLIAPARNQLNYHLGPVDKLIRLPEERSLQIAEKSKKSLAICSCEDDNEQLNAFVSQLKESLGTLGLHVSTVLRVELLNVVRQNQTYMVLVIFSSIDSNLLDELQATEFTRYPDAKLVLINYGFPCEYGPPVIPLPSDHDHARNSNLVKNIIHFLISNNDVGPNEFDYKVRFKSLINEIVLKHTNHKCKVFVTEFPAGLMKSQQNLEDIIHNHHKILKQGKHVSIGIVGMGGIGKTTLVSSFYNKFHSTFNVSILLLDIREKTRRPSGLLHLQEDMFKGVLGDRHARAHDNFLDVCEGIACLSHKFANIKALIILDDVEDRLQMEALFSPILDQLASKSVVIVTSRNRDVLHGHPVSEIYEMGLLDSDSARLLFYWHAFLKPFPPDPLKKVTQEVIDACQGLPLSLKFIAAHVYGNTDNIEVWKETLRDIRQAREVLEVLRVSVDALEEYHQEAFIDVCCFLIGRPVQTVVRFWGHCWRTLTTLAFVKVLKNKCLITEDPKDGTIGMHDQIRDMGRYIAAQQPIKTRIWDVRTAEDIRNQDDKVIGSSLSGLAWISQDVTLCDAADWLLPIRVRLLLVRNVHMRTDQEFPDVRYDQLRWLQWQHSNFTHLLGGLSCSRELGILDLSRSSTLQALWRDAVEVPEQLQEPNLSGGTNLTNLIVSECDNLLSCDKLEWCSLNGCKQLLRLPDNIGSMRQLKFLDLSGCEKLQCLPDSVDGLRTLEQLLLAGCTSLASLPDSLGELYSLTEMCID
ncbi:hypothetical protein GOP47_0026368 [Adiantum capillus-veneris]|nr:hypothetical protein GOP47_0026368 [Adiantum capillus-veneris]